MKIADIQAITQEARIKKDKALKCAIGPLINEVIDAAVAAAQDGEHEVIVDIPQNLLPAIAAHFVREGFKVYPNPFMETITLNWVIVSVRC